VFEKPGYVSESRELSLSTEGEYPAETVILVRFPPGRGLYYRTAEGYLAVATCRVEQQQKAEGEGYGTSVTRTYSVYGDPTVVAAGHAEFADWREDNHTQEVALFKLSSGFVLGSIVEDWIGSRKGGQPPAEVMMQKRSLSAGLLLRSTSVAPGVYVFVPGQKYLLESWSKWGFGKIEPGEVGYCFGTANEISTSKPPVQARPQSVFLGQVQGGSNLSPGFLTVTHSDFTFDGRTTSFDLVKLVRPLPWGGCALELWEPAPLGRLGIKGDAFPFKLDSREETQQVCAKLQTAVRKYQSEHPELARRKETPKVFMVMHVLPDSARPSSAQFPCGRQHACPGMLTINPDKTIVAECPFPGRERMRPDCFDHRHRDVLSMANDGAVNSVRVAEGGTCLVFEGHEGQAVLRLSASGQIVNGILEAFRSMGHTGELP
jgi:hypothetical protein